MEVGLICIGGTNISGVKYQYIFYAQDLYSANANAITNLTMSTIITTCTRHGLHQSTTS